MQVVGEVTYLHFAVHEYSAVRVMIIYHHLDLLDDRASIISLWISCREILEQALSYIQKKKQLISFNYSWEQFITVPLTTFLYSVCKIN